MKISTKGDYATRAMQDLAWHYEKGPIQIEEIARRQHLPVRYLEQILLSLKRAGFLESKRGVRDRKSTRLNSSHIQKSRMPSSA